MNTATCHHCYADVELELVEGEYVLSQHHIRPDELCEGSGERPVTVREQTD